MVFSEKLQLIRKSRGVTQEELAERLCVSRQAVAKWESGQTYPDIGNLIALSDLFRVTVDHLVRDDDGCGTALLPAEAGDDAAFTAALAAFLVRAKIATYAGKGAECTPSRPASHDFSYEKGAFRYIDTYLGGERFAGEEAAYCHGAPVYAMNYCGRVLSDAFSGDFLKAALRAVPESMPYRGPAFY